jgi:hypothetical protein
MCQYFIIFCAAGVRTLPLVSTDHGSAAVMTTKAAAVAEEPAAVAGSAAAVATAAAATAMATEVGTMVVVASFTSSIRNFFLSNMLYPNFSVSSLPPLMQTLMMVAVLEALPKQAAEAAKERASPQLHAHMRQ